MTALAPNESDRIRVQTWLEALDAWYAEIAGNSHFQERAHCYFERVGGTAHLKLAVALAPTPAPSAPAPGADASLAPAPINVENTSKSEGLASLFNERPALATLLPTREEAQGRVVLRQRAPAKPMEGGSRTSHESNANKPLQPTEAAAAAGSDFKTTQSRSFAIDNISFMLASSSALNHDLLRLLVLAPPPAESTGNLTALAATLTPEVLNLDEHLRSEGARYGILLRACLIAMVTGSKANLALHINRLEDLRTLLDEAEALPLPAAQRAYLMHSLWNLLDNTREAAPVPDEQRELPGKLRQALSDPSDASPANWRHLLWYRWNVILPVCVSRRLGWLTGFGHLLAFGAFASLMLLALGLLDTTLPAIVLASAAGLVYALTTQRLALPERVALSINDKIETVLDSTLADLMKANMDVQIGRLGRGEPPGLTPESVARRLDDAFALKEMVNSYESTVRARRRHVAAEVGKAQRIRLESHQRLRNAALGVTASFVLLEIGSRIQEHRDLQAGTDPYSYAYWLERGKTDAAVASPQAAAEAPLTTLDCARTEIVQHQAASPECLDQWRESALASSSQLLFLVFLIAMLMFAVRVMRRAESSDAP